MAKRVEQNERTKRDYIFFLEETEGLDEKSTDKVLAAILKFEESTGFKPFTKFHIEQAARFKRDLNRAKNPRTGKPLSHATIDATLALVRKFFTWLAGRNGYRSKFTYSDAAYFKNNRKNARIAHAQRDVPYSSMKAALHAFQAMPNSTETQRRDKALFAFLMLTGARIGAVATLKLKHVNLTECHVRQDSREVATKNSKDIDTWFFPVDAAYQECFTAWLNFLKNEKFFGPEDALFPKALVGIKEGEGFANLGLSREGYSSTANLNKIIRTAFANVQMPEYTPHSFRKTLFLYGAERCETLEEIKAWSRNLGHENLATSYNSYLPMSRERQREILQKFRG
ncbi:tyrosine-type recombinase/integrase [Litoreibacter arenae]|uniref:Site-specific recombinase XerC n=1 Tax=Litoreibacter arenae DSM 19593 TaxID=1123360 RepID=S9RQB6_9RHOB|nr:site-specific integrase [Litoreibacter arenae]EPX80255.1 Site-specific recombinase XerC [Litoreibacter arenae DSM 19593]